MAFHVAFESPGSVGVVLNAIREQTREWRESAMPPDLRAMGHLGVYSKIKGSRFTLGYESNHYEHVPVELVGVVAPYRTGSRVEASCGRPAWWIGPAAFGGVGVASLLSGSLSGIWALSLGGACALFLRGRHEAVSYESNEARHLLERLERAVASTTRSAG